MASLPLLVLVIIANWFKNMLATVKHIFFTVAVLLFFSVSFAQEEVLDSIAAQKNMEEIKQEQLHLNFQNFFFEALQQKAIGNYDKAIEALENCQTIRKDDVAVIFEFSKNYFAQEKFFEATQLAKKALEKKPNDIFVLLHLKNIHVKENNYKAALEVQQKIVAQNPQYQGDLILLYIRNGQIEEARQLLLNLEKQGLITESLEPFKESLFPKSRIAKNIPQEPKQLEKQSLTELKKSYATNKSFALLKKILNEQFSANQFSDLVTESKEGLNLFPAQPFVYLMHAKGLNKLKKHTEAITFLKNGLDYVIDDLNTEVNFYEELSISFKGLGNKAEAAKYEKLAQEKRTKKS